MSFTPAYPPLLNPLCDSYKGPQGNDAAGSWSGRERGCGAGQPQHGARRWGGSRDVVHAADDLAVTVSIRHLGAADVCREADLRRGLRLAVVRRGRAEAAAGEVNDALELAVVEEVVERPDAVLLLERGLVAAVRAIRVHVAVRQRARLHSRRARLLKSRPSAQARGSTRMQQAEPPSGGCGQAYTPGCVRRERWVVRSTGRERFLRPSAI